MQRNTRSNTSASGKGWTPMHVDVYTGGDVVSYPDILIAA